MPEMKKIAVDPNLLVDAATHIDAGGTFAKKAMETIDAFAIDADKASKKIASAIDQLVRCGSIPQEKRASYLEKAATQEGAADILLKTAELVVRQGEKLAAASNKQLDRLASPGAAAPAGTEKTAANGIGGSVGAVPQAARLSDAENNFLSRMTSR